MNDADFDKKKVKDFQWKIIEPLLPGKITDCGVTARDNRLFVNALVWMLYAGAPWSMLPASFGKANSVRKRFRRLAQKGVWQTISEAVAEPDWDWVMLDSTVVRVHQHAAGQRKDNPADPAIGRSRGGLSTKIHACTDALGNGVRLILTEGQAGDAPQTLPLLADLEPKMVIADTSYDSDANREYCTSHQIVAVIPNRPNRLEPAPLDEEYYKDRNKIERFFCRMKKYRRLATRYDKTALSYLSFLHIAMTLDWLR